MVTVTVTALALLAAGCGGGKSGGGTQLSKTQYESRIQKDGDEIKNVFAPLSKPPTSLKVLASELAAGQKKLREAADDLDGIKPPSDVAHDNDILVSGLRKLADQLEPLRKGAAANDPNLVRKGVVALQRSASLKDAQRATDDMKKKGYSIGTLGE